MSMSEPFNFGRKIKELKRAYKKSYADLTAGLKISRERIIALEEGEREPTDAERQRFAAFYNLPVEDFLPSQGRVAPRPVTPSQPMNRTPYPNSNSNPSSRPMMNNRPAPSGSVGSSAPRAPQPMQSRPASSGTTNTVAPKSVASTNGESETTSEKKPQGEPKPVMKYTAEQLGDIESAYLRKQRDLKVPLRFTFLNGQEFVGVVVDFTPFTIHIQDELTQEEIILRKLAIAYYRKADALEEAKEGGS
jgi:transcriptional regulator with XRE-family HTH domain/sRNA-binding regulator protein Hfq